MKLYELPLEVKDAILASAIAGASRQEEHEFVPFWNTVLSGEYSSPCRTQPTEVKSLETDKEKPQ